MAHGIVRTDNLSGTTLGKNLVSILYKESNAVKDIDNGNVCVIGGFETTGNFGAEVRTGTKPAANTSLDKIALIASEEIVKSKKVNTLAEFYNEAGIPARGYRLRKGDQFSVTADAIDGTPSLTSAAVLELQAGTKMKAVASLTSGSTKVADLIAVEGEWFVYEVV